MKKEDYLEFAEYCIKYYYHTEWEGYYKHIESSNLKENWFKMGTIFDNWKKYWWSKRKIQRTRKHD